MLYDDSKIFSCPYCGSDNDLPIDPTGGRRQRFIVDCEVCCQPITVGLAFSDGDWDIQVRREND